MEKRHRNSPWTASGKKTIEMEYKLGTKILSQNEEFARFKKEMRRSFQGE